MTVKASQSATLALPHIETNRGLERRHLPVFVWLGGAVLLMNVSSAVLSLMA
jgi:hypothetical protein